MVKPNILQVPWKRFPPPTDRDEQRISIRSGAMSYNSLEMQGILVDEHIIYYEEYLSRLKQLRDKHGNQSNIPPEEMNSLV